MGLFTNDIFSILKLNKDNDGTKSLCMMGKQDLHVDLVSLKTLITQYGIHYNVDEYDKLISKDNEDPPIDSIEFFKIFGFSEVHAVDISAYEGADIILDLNKELPPDLYQRFDFVIDGGTLEHVFDLATAIKNMANMVRKGGYIMHFTPAAGMVDHGFYSVSPYLYSSFYHANGFEVQDLELRFLKYDLSKRAHYIPYGHSLDCRLISKGTFINRVIYDMQKAVGDEYYMRTLVFCSARKMDNNTVSVHPIQHFDV